MLPKDDVLRMDADKGQDRDKGAESGPGSGTGRVAGLWRKW